MKMRMAMVMDSADDQHHDDNSDGHNDCVSLCCAWCVRVYVSVRRQAGMHNLGMSASVFSCCKQLRKVWL